MSTKIKKNSEGKRVYELAFLLKDSTSEKTVLDFLAQHKAVVINRSQINSIKLAYPVKKHLSAFFGFINFEAEPENVKALSGALNLNNEVLRFLVISIPVHKKSPERLERANERFELRKSNKIEPVSPKSGLSNKALEEKLEEILK